MTLMTSRTWTSYCLQALLTCKAELDDRSYLSLWNDNLESGNIYVKLDDGVVYIDDDAIPLAVGTLIINFESVVVSARMANFSELNPLQYQTSAILPYLPDLNYARYRPLKIPSGRAPKLPDWIEPAEVMAPESRDDWNDYIKKRIGGG
jgi:hypothetical protein